MPDTPAAGRLGRLLDPVHLRRALVANLWLQGVIIVTGGLVRLTSSGLGCPTWPQCVPGSFTPTAHQEQGWHSLVEFGNRLMTFVLAAVALWLFAAAVRRWRELRSREAARFAAWCFLPGFGIILQAIVGGISVRTQLDPKTVSPHFLLSALLVAFSAWLLVRHEEGDGPARATVARLPRVLAQVAGCAYAVVLVIGTAVTGSGPHSGDRADIVRFGFDPLLTSRLHSAAVWLFVACTLAMVVLTRGDRGPRRVRNRWVAVLALAVAEGMVGYAQYFSGLPMGLVIIHLTLSAVLCAVVTLAVLSTRRRDAVAGTGHDTLSTATSRGTATEPVSAR